MLVWDKFFKACVSIEACEWAGELVRACKRGSIAHGKDDSVFGARAADFEER
jgi:hypothetical protein